MSSYFRRFITAICFLTAAMCASISQAQGAPCGEPHSGGTPALPAMATLRESTDTLVVAFLGDSNLWIGGDDCSRPQGWSYWFCGMMNPVTARSYARSGATWTHTSATNIDTAFYSERLAPDNVIRPQAERLIGDVQSGRFTVPSVIFIGAGTNDAWFAEHRPGLWGDDISVPTTLAGSIHSTVKRLRQVFPQARIVLLTPPPTTATTPQRIARVSDIIAAEGGRLGVDVVRLDTLCPFEPQYEKRTPRFTTDGTHTSPAGGKMIAFLVIKTIFPPAQSQTE